MKPVLFSFISLCLSFGLFAQTSFTEEAVAGLFEKPEKIKWVRYFKGRIDDLNNVAVTLAYDGKYCKGQMVYLSSKERFRLDGILRGNEVKLKEINHAAEVSGQLQGKLEGTELLLDWSNYDHSIGCTLTMEEVAREPVTSSHCGDDKWFRIYKGIIFGSQVELILQKDSKSGLRGLTWFEQDNISYRLKGDLTVSGAFKIVLKDDFGRLKGTLEGSLKNEDRISANFFKTDGQRCPTVLSMEEQFDMGCIEYADYMSGYDITYPRTSNHRFNYWIDGLGKDWVKACKEYAGAIKARSVQTDPKRRASVRSFAWSDLSMYDDKLISGFITYNNTWDMGVQGRAFTFHLEKGREITLQDIFLGDFDHKQFLKTYIDKHITDHELYRDFDFRQWLARQEFALFYLKKEGICFSTRFDMVYGKQQITIPYTELEPFMKKDNPVRHLIK